MRLPWSSKNGIPPMRLFGTALVIASLAATAPVHADGDVGNGAAIFEQFCRQCHVPIPGDPLAAPRLNGIVGRPVGTEPGYRYSDAFLAKRAEGLVWTEDRLESFLRDPQDAIPGTIMAFVGVKRAGSRRDLLAYLRALD